MSRPDTAVSSLASTDDETLANVYSTISDGDGVVTRFRRPRASVPTTIAVVSDPHVATDARGTWKMYHRTRTRFRDALRAIEGRRVDCLVVAGDLTKDGAQDDLDWIEDALEASDVPHLPVPGNHDVKEVPLSDFEGRFASDGYPVSRRVGDVDVVGLDSTMAPASSDEEADGSADGGAVGGVGGVVSADQLEWLEANLPNASEPIVVMHHNLPGVVDAIGQDEWVPHPPVENADALLDVLERHRVPLHVSGHVHVLSLTVQRDVRGLVAPALSSFPQSYLLLEIDPSGTTVRCRTAADAAGVEEAYRASRRWSARSRRVSDVNAALLSNPPIFDAQRDAGETPAIALDDPFST